MKAIKWILIASGFTLLLSGCAVKPEIIERTVYVKEEPWSFEKLDMNGVYIELESKEVQRICTPSLLKLDELHRGVRKFYEEQIDAYEESRSDAR